MQQQAAKVQVVSVVNIKLLDLNASRLMNVLLCNGWVKGPGVSDEFGRSDADAWRYESNANKATNIRVIVLFRGVS